MTSECKHLFSLCSSVLSVAGLPVLGSTESTSVMAKPVSEEELQLKKRARRRLIGAIALVAAVAAILPMVLDTDPKPTSQEINIQIPSPDAKGGFAAKVVPLPAPAGKSAVTPKAEATVQPAAQAPEAQKEATASKPEREKAPEKAPSLKPAPGTFFIQVIALSDAGKAQQVQQQIIDAGIVSYVDVVAAGTGKVTRVRAGPFATRDEAERARAQLAALGLEGKVAAQ